MCEDNILPFIGSAFHMCYSIWVGVFFRFFPIITKTPNVIPREFTTSPGPKRASVLVDYRRHHTTWRNKKSPALIDLYRGCYVHVDIYIRILTVYYIPPRTLTWLDGKSPFLGWFSSVMLVFRE